MEEHEVVAGDRLQAKSYRVILEDVRRSRLEEGREDIETTHRRLIKLERRLAKGEDHKPPKKGA